MEHVVPIIKLNILVRFTFIIHLKYYIMIVIVRKDNNNNKTHVLNLFAQILASQLYLHEMDLNTFY